MPEMSTWPTPREPFPEEAEALALLRAGVSASDVYIHRWQDPATMHERINQPLLELAVAIYVETPIVVLNLDPDGPPVPPGLRKIALEVIDADSMEDGFRKMTDLLNRMSEPSP